MDAGKTQPRETAHESVADRRREAIHRTRGLLAGLMPERCLSEELIAERRQEARREDDAPTHA